DLARLAGLEVAARGEVLPYRERPLPPRTIARELGVGYVVQGSVRRAGARGRISAQLVRASDGHAVWAERYDRTLEDLFDVQAEIRAAQLLDSNDPEIMIWMGRSYMGLGRAEEAIAVLERALALRPRDYRVISAYADCSDMLGRGQVVAAMLARIREVLVEAL